VTISRQDTHESPPSPATAATWRRRRNDWVLPPPADDGEHHVAVDVIPRGTPDTAVCSFAESQQAGLIAMLNLAKIDASPPSPPTAKSRAPGHEPLTSTQILANAAPVQPAPIGAPPSTADRPAIPGGRAAANPRRLPATVTQASLEGEPVPSGHRLSHLPAFLTLIVILTVQATMSARLIGRYTAFNDEALYLWAGRLEWSHWLHGTPVPLFQTYFSGAPAIYPPLGALVDSIGGLAGARLLSLCFMLGATTLLWSTASRLYNRRTATFAAGLWAILGPTQHLGSYATYDAMALFLVALAAWCATGRKDSEDATGWILAAAGSLAFANATKYASALFDPVVIGLAMASAWPHPGGKVALRRATLLTACTFGTLSLLARLGGPLYLRGIEQTTLARTGNTSPVLTVIGQSWAWIGSVAVIAVVAVILSWRRPRIVLTALLAGAVLLVPIEQARIHTTTSLNKHVDFGAWFAAIAAGYAIRQIISLPRPRIIRAGLASACVICLFAASQVGALQARNMLYGYWPNEARLIAALRPLTAEGGNFLAEGQYIPAYYLRKTSWQDWSNTRSVRGPGGRTISVPVGGQGSPPVYEALIARHYFSVVLLTFTDTIALDNDIARYLRETSGYRVASTIPFGPTRHGNYTIWVYDPHIHRDAR
jgi:hypothetical protein